MLFDKFVEETKDWWDKYFNFVAKAESEGKLRTQSLESDPVGYDLSGHKILFPNMLIVTNCSGFYIAELVGAVEKYSGLTVKRHRENSIYRYFSQFDGSQPEGVFAFQGDRNILSSTCLAHGRDLEAVSDRFPHLDLYKTQFVKEGGHGSSVAFADDFESLIIEDCILLNSHKNLKRCKGILYLGVVKSSIRKPELQGLYSKSCSRGVVMAVHTVDSNEERVVIGGQLQSMVLFPSLHETTIGEFLKLHPDIIKTVFKSSVVLYEPYLTWEEHDGTCEDTAINPDLLVQRGDGFFDIYDLKTALLDKARITKASRSRRRFIDYVEEGIAQLANYREYFSYPKNAALAKEKYGVEVKDPKLVLVVGSWDNVDPVEVEQASRKHGDLIEVIDYDTICQMFIGLKMPIANSIE
jgi:hypothetical protein